MKNGATEGTQLKHKRNVVRKKGLNKIDTFVLAFGAMIGWGWVVLSGEWILRAGTLGAAIAFVFGGIMVLFVSQLYAELTTAIPGEGGAFLFSERAFNIRVAFVCVWMLLLSYIAVIAFEAVALPTVVSYLFPQYVRGYLYTVAGFDVYATWLILGILASLFLMFINILGIKTATFMQTVLTVVVLLVGAMFFTGAFINGDLGNAQPLFADGLSGIIGVMVMTPFMYVGFDVIPQTASEMNIPKKKIGQILILAVAIAVLWYVLIIAGVGVTMNHGQMQHSSIITADAMANAYGGSRIASNVLIIGGIAGILSCWNAFYIGGSRVLCSLAAKGLLPAILAKKHPKYGTPYVGVLLIGGLTTCAPFLGRNMLVWLSNSGGFGTVITYFIISLSFLVLRKKEPTLDRPYKVRYPYLIGFGALLCCLCLIVLYTPGMPSSLRWPYEWGIIIAWAIVGAVLYGFAAQKRNRAKRRVSFEQ